MATKRRGHHEGSIYQRRDGRWVGVLHVGYGGGRRERKSYYGTTRPEVASKLANAIANHNKGLRPVPERQRVRDYLESWLNDTARRSIRGTTFAGYERMIRLHINPIIGDLRVARLAADHLDNLYTQLLDKGLAPKSVSLIHALLHRALSHAQRRGAVAVNAATNVDPPRIPNREFQALSADEAVHLLDASRGDRLHALYVVALTCGLRQAELLGLRWRDVDLDGAVLAVRQQVYRLAGEWVFSEPKTTKGRRTISLSAMAVEALRQHRVRQAEERLRVGADWQDYDLVFPNHLGRPIEKQNLMRRSFRPLLGRAGLPPMRFHDLRHSAATLLLAEGVHPKVVQERLGHSTIAVTMDVYSHVMPTLQKDAAERLDRLLAAR
jgi:integrase